MWKRVEGVVKDLPLEAHEFTPEQVQHLAKLLLVTIAAYNATFNDNTYDRLSVISGRDAKEKVFPPPPKPPNRRPSYYQLRVLKFLEGKVKRVERYRGAYESLEKTGHYFGTATFEAVVNKGWMKRKSGDVYVTSKVGLEVYNKYPFRNVTLPKPSSK